MHHLCTAALMLMLGGQSAGTIVSQDRPTTFGGMKYGSSKAIATTRMRELGFSPKKVPDGLQTRLNPLDALWQGQLRGQVANVILAFTPRDSLEAVIISFLTEDRECLPFHRTMLSELIQKYGEPQYKIELFQRPYDGPAQQETAVKAGKAHVHAAWTLPGRSDLEIRVTEALTVSVAYRSDLWNNEVIRRQNNEESPIF
jgi:hypothetical protein